MLLSKGRRFFLADFVNAHWELNTIHRLKKTLKTSFHFLKILKVPAKITNRQIVPRKKKKKKNIGCG